MFLENKYTKIYMNIMNRAKTRIDLMEGEYHHVIPKSLGGSDTQTNIVKLTYREHFLAHAILTKICITPKHRRSMAFAFISMKGGNSRRPYQNSRLYEKVKRQISIHFSGELNPFYGKGYFGADNHFFGKTHSEESRTKIRQSLIGKNIGENNHFFGKTHSEETKKAIQKQRSIPIKVTFLDGTQIVFENRLQLGKYINMSESLGASLLREEKRHLWKKYNISTIEVVTDENKVN